MRPRIAVIGAGHLGRIHARHLAEMPDVQLVGVVDPLPEARNALAADLQVPALPCHTQLLKQVDAAVVAAPSTQHAEIGKSLLRSGIHVFMEKPLATSARDAARLVSLARNHNAILQIGHVERFNPAWKAFRQRLACPPLYLEARRLTPYSFRSTDVSVVWDLMIHDLDLALQLAGQEVVRVSAIGVNVIGSHEDFAQARLEFRNGCIANLTASRVSTTPCRGWQIVGPNTFAQVDLAAPAVEIVRASSAVAAGTFPDRNLAPGDLQQLRADFFQTVMPREVIPVPGGDAIADELRQFLDALRHGRPPEVDGRVGCAAVELAERVMESIASNRARQLQQVLGFAGDLARPWPDSPPVVASNRRRAG